jgi:hypothetical protein
MPGVNAFTKRRVSRPMGTARTEPPAGPVPGRGCRSGLPARPAGSTRDLLGIAEQFKTAEAGGVRFGHPAKLTSDQLTLAQRLIEEGRSIPEVVKRLKVYRATL